MGIFLVSGAAGFIGSRVSQFLLESGHKVIGVDNLDPSYDLRLKKWRLKNYLNHEAFIFHKEDICNRNFLNEIGRKHPGIKAIVNLAAKAGVRDSVIDPWGYYQTNLTGTLNLLEMCRDFKINKFILASTSSVYGEDVSFPTPESSGTNFPLQPYAASKKAAETLCYSYHFLYSLDITVLRYFTVYGPAGRPGMSMYRFTKWIEDNQEVKIFGDGEQTRGYTYLDDIAEGTVAALKPVGYEIINLGGHETISINRLVEKFENIIGKSAKKKYYPAHPADMSASWADTSKAKEMLGWSPKFNLDQGMQRVVEWYRQEHSWASQVEVE